MKTRLILASILLLTTGCGRDGTSKGEAKETPLEVASTPFTIGNEVADQMGTNVGEMGRDDGDQALNALAELPEAAADGNEEAATASASDDGSSNASYTPPEDPIG